MNHTMCLCEEYLDKFKLDDVSIEVAKLKQIHISNNFSPRTSFIVLEIDRNFVKNEPFPEMN